MTSSIDEIVRIKNKVMKGYKEEHPGLSKVLSKFFSNSRWGYQLLDERGKVLEEYTLVADSACYLSAMKGISNVRFTVGMKKSCLEELMKEVIASEDSFVKHPISSTMKYLPRYAYHFVHGDIKFGRTKD